MSEYIVRFWQDDQYEIVNSDGEQLYRGNIVEVNAWLEMAKKGYELRTPNPNQIREKNNMCEVKDCTETEPHIHNIDLGWSVIETKLRKEVI